MSKGLEALESIEESFKFNVDKYVWQANKNDFKTIEKELKRLEEIDDILNTGGGIWAENGIVSKKLKALEVIKPFLKNIRLEENEKGEYEVLIDVINNDKPLVIARFNSKEQFDLLKEVLL